MSHEIPFDPKAVCGVCGTKGAYDFMGDLLCPKCAKKATHSEGTMSDGRCPEHNCDIAACFDLGHQEGTMSGVAFEKEFAKAKGDKLFIDFLRPLAEHFWQAALAHVRKEFAQVTGLGTESSIEETLEHYVDTINRAVNWRDELAYLREPMKCGHLKANLVVDEKVGEICLACLAVAHQQLASAKLWSKVCELERRNHDAQRQKEIERLCEAVKEAVNAALLEAVNRAKGSFTVEEAIRKIYGLREEERK